MPVLLLLLFSLALSTGTAMVIFVIRRAQAHRFGGPVSIPIHNNSEAIYQSARKSYLRRPTCWMAIKGRSLIAVQSALKLHNPKPCSWFDGLAGEEKLFIAPPVRGWILVLGSGLPDPSEDVDACFRFVSTLSRKLGHVQLFSLSRILHHHAWVRAERGRIVRAYAWAGKTVWQQGSKTSAEIDLDLVCFEYADPFDRVGFGQSEGVLSNVDKVPLLAARWSLDPAAIDEQFLDQECGIAGEPSRVY